MDKVDEKHLARVRKWQKENPEKTRRYVRRRQQEIRLEVLLHYSNGELKCAHCGETELIFLSIDHIHGGGEKHRKEIGCRGGTCFYYWLKKNNYPSGYRVLCLNCNWHFDFKRGERKRTFNARIHKPICQCCGEDRLECLGFSKKHNKTLCKNCIHALTFYESCPHQNR